MNDRADLDTIRAIGEELAAWAVEAGVDPRERVVALVAALDRLEKELEDIKHDRDYYHRWCGDWRSQVIKLEKELEDVKEERNYLAKELTFIRSVMP